MSRTDSLHILLADKDRSSSGSLCNLLSDCGYRVTAVFDGETVLQRLCQEPKSFDLLLSDVHVPGATGVEILQRIGNTPHICSLPVVVMCESEDSQDLVLECLGAGACDCLSKPVKQQDLSGLWQHVWRRRSLDAPFPLKNMGQFLGHELKSGKAVLSLQPVEMPILGMLHTSPAAGKGSCGSPAGKLLHMCDRERLAPDQASDVSSRECLGDGSAGRDPSGSGGDRPVSAAESEDEVTPCSTRCASSNEEPMPRASSLPAGKSCARPSPCGWLEGSHAEGSSLQTAPPGPSELPNRPGTEASLSGGPWLADGSPGQVVFDMPSLSAYLYMQNLFSQAMHTGDPAYCSMAAAWAQQFGAMQMVPGAAVGAPAEMRPLELGAERMVPAKRPRPEDAPAETIAQSKRAAAIAKFREKRKNRNFERKVRYESRKRLADGRPRVRGQFVKRGEAASSS